ncbi:MAG TPA: tetratricopeptide repeat protein [Casimicrobiaceae bacterium]|nr:tetratricopeptide repeat protein [Casimicrobiaceae bacterium]
MMADSPSPPGKSAALASFERMLAAGKDSALLRYSIGNEHAKAKNWPAAAEALSHAVSLDPNFTAAWKLYGRVLLETGQPQEALDAYRQGIDVARRKGDRQAEKEMTVFARRIERALASG